MWRTAFQLVDLGDKNNGRKAHDFGSNDDVWIATEVHQAAQPLLLCNGNAGIQSARTARITAIRPPAIDGHEGRRSVEIILGVYKAAETGKPVKLPLKYRRARS
jgi:hypothetical protein